MGFLEKEKKNADNKCQARMGEEKDKLCEMEFFSQLRLGAANWRFQDNFSWMRLRLIQEVPPNSAALFFGAVTGQSYLMEPTLLRKGVNNLNYSIWTRQKIKPGSPGEKLNLVHSEWVYSGLNKQLCPSTPALRRFETQILRNSALSQGLTRGGHKLIPSNV